MAEFRKYMSRRSRKRGEKRFKEKAGRHANDSQSASFARANNTGNKGRATGTERIAWENIRATKKTDNALSGNHKFSFSEIATVKIAKIGIYTLALYLIVFIRSFFSILTAPFWVVRNYILYCKESGLRIGFLWYLRWVVIHNV